MRDTEIEVKRVHDYKKNGKTFEIRRKTLQKSTVYEH